MATKDDGNFKLIEGMKGKLPKENEELTKLLKLMTDNFEKLIKLNAYQAQIKRAYFKDLTKEGFTEEQALRIILNDMGKT